MFPKLSLWIVIWTFFFSGFWLIFELFFRQQNHAGDTNIIYFVIAGFVAGIAASHFTGGYEE